MNFANRYGKFLIVLAVLIIGATIFGPRVGAQDEGWRIIRAEYGYRTQRADVTNLLNELIARGGDNGQIYVNDGPLGGDPRPRARKDAVCPGQESKWRGTHI